MMKSHKITIIIVTLLWVTGCLQEPETAGSERVKTVNVQTEKIEPRRFERHIQLVGTVNSENDVRISAEVSGRIEKYYIRKGETVKKGEPILKIDDDKLLREMARLEAQTEQAREQYERLKRVFEQDSVGSEIELINARTAYRQSKSALESITVDLSNTTVRAPFDARLEERFLKKGEMAVPGEPLVRLIGTEQLKITAGVPARYADVVEEGDSVKVWFDTQEPDTLTAPIAYVGNSIDPQNRTFTIDVELTGDGASPKVATVANLKLNTLSESNVIVVSEEFVYKDKDEFVAYVLAYNEEGEEIAEKRTVRLGPSFRSDVIILDGLKRGEELITIGSAFLNDGTRVNIIEPEEKSLARQ